MATRGEPLVDAFGRVVRDLRISVTDRCNFRCTYCMPSAGIPLRPRSNLMTFSEIARLVGVFADLGVETVRLTGGEPLVRKDIEVLVAMLSRLGVKEVALSTNAFLLAEKAQALAASGLSRVNVSIDSLMRHRFAEITRVDALDRVLRGVEEAERSGLVPIKINCVVLRGTNDDEIVDLARFARTSGHEVRFIEYMPLDGDDSWKPNQVVSGADVLATIAREFPLLPIAGVSGPSELFDFADGSPGRVGVISSVTAPFCSRCDRVRVTADGKLRTCLFSDDQTDLLSGMRAGCTDEDLIALIRDSVVRKWAGHSIGSEGFRRPKMSMSMIGG